VTRHEAPIPIKMSNLAVSCSGLLCFGARDRIEYRAENDRDKCSRRNGVLCAERSNIHKISEAYLTSGTVAKKVAIALRGVIKG
jgi:hypothetical protein